MILGRSENGVIVEVAEVDQENMPDFLSDWVKDVAIGWVLEGGKWAPPPEPRPSKRELLAFAAERRWQKETGGIIVGVTPIKTDRESQGLIQGARLAVLVNPAFTTKFKSASVFVDMDAAGIIEVSDAALAHVAACFAIEADVTEQIDAETITTLAEVEAAFA